MRRHIYANFQILKATSPHLPQLQSLSLQTFTEAFTEGNTEENMKQYLAESFSSEKLLEELNNPDSEFYFVMDNQHPAGYLKLNFNNAQTELKETHGIEIERIYVLQQYQGKKVGKLLLNLALQIAKNKKATYLWLGVWERNTKAIEFYKRNGFVQFDTHPFVFGKEIQTDLMMKLELT